MPNAATVADVEDLLGADLTADTDRVNRLLERAERTIAGDLPGFRFGHITGAAVELDGDGLDVLRLPYYPVRQVTAVTVDGTPLEAGAYTVDVLGNLRRRSTDATFNPHAGALDGLRRRWPDRGTIIVVTYDYGFNASATYAGANASSLTDTATADVIRDVAAELAAGRIVNPSQAAQEALGDRSISYGGAGSANADGLTVEQRRRLRHWRRDRFGTTRVGS